MNRDLFLSQRVAFYALNGFPGIPTEKNLLEPVRQNFLLFQKFLSGELRQRGITYILDEVTSNTALPNDAKNVCKINGAAFTVDEPCIELPPPLYVILQEIGGVALDKAPPKMKWGHLDRSICFTQDNSVTSASVVSGAHCVPLNEITFDLTSYVTLGVEALGLRFAHEILHDFGLCEEAVLQTERSFWENIRACIADIMCEFFLLLSHSYRHLDCSVYSAITNNPYWAQQLVLMNDQLTQYGALPPGIVLHGEHPVLPGQHVHIEVF